MLCKIFPASLKDTATWRLLRRCYRLLVPTAQTKVAPPFVTMCPDTLPALEAAFRVVDEQKIVGDYLEFGLYKGYTLWHAQRCADRFDLDAIRFFGFDSFRGLPQPYGVDASTDEFKKGDYACTLHEVRDNLSRHGIQWDRTWLIPGFYEESLKSELYDTYGLRKAAIVLIDCDLYASTICVLRFLEPILQHGTLLLFDDWNCFGRSNDKGQRLALKEFLASGISWKTDELFSFGWHGQAFQVRLG